MGLDDLMLEWHDRGYGPVDKHAVCPAHVHDAWLAARVVDHADQACTYCASEGAASLEAVMPFVMDAIKGYYVPAIEHLAWDGLANAPDGEEVLYDISEGVDFDEAVARDIAEALSHDDQRWTSLRSHFEGWLEEGWDRFCEWVTTESRFLLGVPSSERFRPPGEAPRHMLGAISDLILEEGLIKSLPEGTSVYRARTVKAGLAFDEPWQLSAPRAERATAGRMNSPGIPLFYGALDPETAAIEVYDGNRTAAVAAFTTVTGLELVDLTHLPELPSVYDAEQHPRRDNLSFLARFADHIARPIDRDGEEQLAYLPSQAVTEHLRLVLPSAAGTPVHGVLFRSSRLQPRSPLIGGTGRPAEGVNIVLFCGSHGALADDQLPKEGPSLAAFRQDEQWLQLLGRSVKLYEYGPPSVRESETSSLDGA